MDLCWLIDSGEKGKIKILKLILRNGANKNVRLRKLQSVSRVIKVKDEILPKKAMK